jgi:cytochrome c-type biogenesis protein CcmH/NrfG
MAGVLSCLTTAVFFGFGIAAWQWCRAERQRDAAQLHSRQAETSLREAHRAVREFQTRIDAMKGFDQPQQLALRRELLQTALGSYRRLLRLRAFDAQIKVDTARTAYALGLVTADLGERTPATELFRASTGLWQDITYGKPPDQDDWHCLAKAYLQLGNGHAFERNWPEAHKSYRSALDIWESLCQGSPASGE